MVNEADISWVLFRTCHSGVCRFTSVLSFVLNISFTSQQQQSFLVSCCICLTALGCLCHPHCQGMAEQQCQQKFPLPGGTGQKIAPHPKECTPGHTGA